MRSARDSPGRRAGEVEDLDALGRRIRGGIGVNADEEVRCVAIAVRCAGVELQRPVAATGQEYGVAAARQLFLQQQRHVQREVTLLQGNSRLAGGGWSDTDGSRIGPTMAGVNADFHRLGLLSG